jgi:hypothetical protein
MSFWARPIVAEMKAVAAPMKASSQARKVIIGNVRAN